MAIRTLSNSEKTPTRAALIRPAALAVLTFLTGVLLSTAGCRYRVQPKITAEGDAPVTADANPHSQTLARPEVSLVERQTDQEELPQPLRRPYQDLRQHTFRTIGEDTGIDVSPDGTVQVFASTQDSNYSKIFLKEENNALVRSITNGNFNDIHPKFSPDGDWIAFASDREGNFDIWMVRLGNPGIAEQMTASPQDEVHPTFSPDGSRIAFCRQSPSRGWTLWIQHREYQSVVELGPGLFPEWSPDGEWIAFQKPSERGERWYAIWMVRPDGTEVRQVVALDDGGVIQPTWSPSGQQIAFIAVSRRPEGSKDWDGKHTFGGDVAIVDLKTGRYFQLTHQEGSNWSPAWGLNGRVFFTSDRYGGRNILSVVPPEVDPL